MYNHNSHLQDNSKDNIFRQNIRGWDYLSIDDKVKCITANEYRVSALNLPPVIHPECSGIDSPFSYYKAPISNTIPSNNWTINDLYHAIATPKYYSNTTVRLRASENPANIKRYNLDYITVAGTFKKRGDEYLINPSGLMVIDIDKIDEPTELKQIISIDKEIDLVMAFISPSGNGLKLIVRVEFEYFTTYFNGYSSYLKHTYKIEIDQSGKDISRSCFLCHDPEVYVNGKFLTI